MYTKAARTYAALSDTDRVAIADAVFNVMEFGDANPDNGEGPGLPWTEDLGKELAAVFARAGVTFTSPEDARVDPDVPFYTEAR